MAKEISRGGATELPETCKKVTQYFFSFPEYVGGLSQLSRQAKISKTAAKTAVVKLVRDGLLEKEEIGKAWRIRLNPKHPYMITRKIPYNLQLVYESGIVDAVYSRIPDARAIILFGSYRWGTDNEKSDIDIAVEVLGSNDLKIESLGRIKRLGLRKDVNVSLHMFSREKIDLNLFTNIANGILLDGVLEVKP